MLLRRSSPQHRSLPRHRAVPWVGALALASLLGAACDRERDPAATPPPARHADAPADVPAPTAPRDDVEVKPPAPAMLAVGDAMPRIEVVDAGGARRCASCDPGPRLLVITGAEAARRDETVRDLDAIARFWSDNGLDAVIVLAELAAEGPRALADGAAEAARGEATTLAAAQRLVTPIATAIDAKPQPWAPTLPAGTTAVLVDRDAKVAWVGGGEPHWRALDQAIAKLLAVAPTK